MPAPPTAFRAQVESLRPCLLRYATLQLRDAAAAEQENEDRCARCGTAFVCGMKADLTHCWCSELPPLEPVPGSGCLCRRCLEDELKTADYLAGTASVRR